MEVARWRLLGRLRVGACWGACAVEVAAALARAGMDGVRKFSGLMCGREIDLELTH